MPLFALDHQISFPPVDLSEPDGLLAMGGDLSTERLLAAYKKGIFPWYEGDTPLWWCPDPRFVLFPEELRVSKSMKVLFKRNAFNFTINKDFPSVIRACKQTPRPGQDGTWITDEVERAYIKLHQLGHAHSAEAWNRPPGNLSPPGDTPLPGNRPSGERSDGLAGGLYGIRMGKVFFGESMFSRADNASKYAFISYVSRLRTEGVQLIDCQVYTEHLENLGARMISRTEFIGLLKTLI